MEVEPPVLLELRYVPDEEFPEPVRVLLGESNHILRGKTGPLEEHPQLTEIVIGREAGSKGTGLPPGADPGGPREVPGAAPSLDLPSRSLSGAPSNPTGVPFDRSTPCSQNYFFSSS